jgi:hypothetical protein
MNFITVVIGWKLGLLSQALPMLFSFSIAIIASIIGVYLFFLIVVSTRLFQSFWASIEDED